MAPPPLSLLRDLLAADGFKNRRKPPDISPAAPRAVSMPLEHRRPSKPARSQSDVLSRGRRNDRDVDANDGDGDAGGELKASWRSSTLASVRSQNNNQNNDTGGSCLIPQLDEAALAALISVVTGAVKRFAKDEDFRASMRRGCASCLGESDHRAVLDLRVIVQTVDRATKEGFDPRDLKRASLKLQSMASLDAKDADAVTAAGVPYPCLAACAHLYTSVISKLQKKDRSSAVHVLEAFRWAPRELRTALLPGLWDRLFRPGLSHLRTWRDMESSGASSDANKKTVERTFNNALDDGTRELACYYIDWLQGRTEAAALPVLPAPPSTVLGSAQQCSSYEVGSDVVLSSGSSASSAWFVPAETLRHSEEEQGEEEEEAVAAEEDTAVDAASVVHEGDAEASSRSPKLHHGLGPEHCAEENDLIPKKLAKDVFEPQLEHAHCKEPEASRNHPQIPNISALELLTLEFCARALQSDKHGNQAPIFTTTPTDFLCPLTRQIFADPVTLETGQTFERAAITEWFNQGIKTCPATCQELETLSLPNSNHVLRRLIDNWKSEHCKNLTAEDIRPKEKLTLTLIENVLAAGRDMSEKFETARHFMAIGGINFLLRRFEEGRVNEKARTAEHLLLCINADGSCRNYVATRLHSSSVLQLLHSEEISARSAAVCLLTELLCLRRAMVELFLRGLQTEAVVETMHALLELLRRSPLEEQALIAVLLLHLDILVEPHRSSIYREEASKSITLALSSCLSEEKVVPNTRKVLLVLGGYFSFSGEFLAEDWMLKQAGLVNIARVASANSDAGKNEVEFVHDNDAAENERWQRNVTLVLLGNGRRSFLEALSKCLTSPDPDLVAACLTTAGWLSNSLASLDATDVQLAAFSALVPRLKQRLVSTQQTRHRVLSSLCLYNFSKIPDCSVLLMLLADGLRDHLTDLTKVTWTAGQLSAELHE